MAKTTPGQLMRAAREKHKKTQAEIAVELDVSQVAVAKWEADETSPRTADVRKVAKAYGLRPEQLLPESAA